MGKKEFYPLVRESLKSAGYEYFDGDKDIRGKGKSHACKPDYIAVKGNTVIIGEIKSSDEGPTSGSWRQIQNSDSENFKRVRREVAEREKLGEISKEIGGHEIIIRGQLSDYFKKLNITYRLPGKIKNFGVFMGGYSVPAKESKNVEKALINCGTMNYETVNNKNGVITFIYSL